MEMPKQVLLQVGVRHDDGGDRLKDTCSCVSVLWMNVLQPPPTYETRSSYGNLESYPRVCVVRPRSRHRYVTKGSPHVTE